MLVSTISLWGAALVACIVIIASIALAFFDRQMLRRIWVIFGATVAQMAVVDSILVRCQRAGRRDSATDDSQKDFRRVIRSGFEPETHSLEGCCSIQLSYQTVLRLQSYKYLGKIQNKKRNFFLFK